MSSHSITGASSTVAMSERETRDLMSVDSFSQLPFIRPSSKPPTSPSSAIRLFGFDFPPDPPSEEQKSAHAEANVAAATTTTVETGRKFECHYCCRNFPTSQALGGHQNAHKRERQHAKRAHLHSAMAAANAHHHHGLIAESHMYGILNYHRLGSSPNVQRSVAARFGLEHPACPPPQYTSWSGIGGGGTRFYSGLGSVSQPITGSPLPGLWKVPSGAMGVVVQRDTTRSIPLPLFGGDLDHSKPPIVSVSPNGVGVGSSFSSSTSSSSSSHQQDLRGCESGAKDQIVSLDLRL